MPRKESGRPDLYLGAAIFMSIIFILYWSSFIVYRFNTFQIGYFDAGLNLYSFYEHVLHPADLPGLQYLVFSNHISVFGLAIAGILFIFRSQFTIFILQYIALAAAALAAYYVGKDIVGNKAIGLSLCFCFLISAGTRGITVYDFHLEAFIPLFYILAFYFYMKDRKPLFLASFAVAILILDSTALLVGLPFVLGMLFFELAHKSIASGSDKRLRRSRFRMLGAAIAMIVMVEAFNALVSIHLANAYALGLYPNTPPSVQYINFEISNVQALLNSSAIPYSTVSLIEATVFGIAILLLGFSITVFTDPILAVILLSPWLAETFLLHNTVFSTLNNEYYAYVLGGAVVAAALSLKMLKEKDYYAKRLTPKLLSGKDLSYLANLNAGLALVVSVFLFTITFSGALGTFAEVNHTALNYSAIDSVLAQVPQNSTVMAPTLVTPHLAYVRYLELPPGTLTAAFTKNGFSAINLTLYWTKPQYVVVDKPFSDYNTTLIKGNDGFNVYAYMGDNYTPVASADNVTVYEEK